MSRLTRRFVLIFGAILTTLAIGTTGFTVIAGYPVFDAFYMSLTTMTTVGYGEIHPLNHAARVFNSFLIVFGVTTIFIAIGAMTQTIIELEFGDAIGKRRNKRMIENLKDHYIICGFGRVGRGAASELQHAGVPFVVVDIDPERVERAMLAGMLAVAADSTHDQTLRHVGIERARGLVAALATDADNLFVLLSAKGLNPKIYVSTRAAEEGAEHKMRRAGADAVFAPYSLTGHRLAQSLLRPHVVQFLDFTTNDIGEDITIEQVRVANHSEMVSRTIKDMQLRKEVGVIVMAIRKESGEMIFNPPAETAVQGGDYLIVMGRPTNLRALEHLLAGSRSARQ
ncbi:MAG: potassium channel protein [Candidatus Solibacter sp.]